MLDGRIAAEMELLLCCAQPGGDPTARLAGLLQLPIDWAEVFRLGLLHGGLPRLHQRFVAMADPNVPPSTLTALSRYAGKSLKRNLALTAELLEIANLLESENIAAVPFKGPTLAARLYGDLESRQFGDLDILVRRRDVPAAEAALRSRGYRAWQELSREQERRCLRNGKDHPFVSRNGAFAVEIHWRFTPSHYPFAMDAESLWPRLEVRPFEGSSLLSIPLEELLLILCVHGTRHRWSALKWVSDVAALISLEEREMDWDLILREAGRLGVQRALFIGLLLAEGLLERPLPAEVGGRVHADPTARSLALQAWKGIASPAPRVEGGVSQYSFQLAAREQLKHRLRILFHLVRSKIGAAGQGRLAEVPAGLRFLLYGLAPLRLVSRYGFRTLRRLLAGAAAGSIGNST